MVVGDILSGLVNIARSVVEGVVVVLLLLLRNRGRVVILEIVARIIVVLLLVILITTRVVVGVAVVKILVSSKSTSKTISRFDVGVIIILLLVTRSGDRRGSNVSNSVVVDLILEETLVRTLLDFRRDGVHLVEVEVEEVSIGVFGVLLIDVLTSVLVLADADASHGVVVGGALGGDVAVRRLDGGLEAEVLGSVGVEDMVLGEVAEDVLAVVARAGGVVLVRERGVLHGDVGGSAEALVVVSHAGVVVVVGVSKRVEAGLLVVVVVGGHFLIGERKKKLMGFCCFFVFF